MDAIPTARRAFALRRLVVRAVLALLICWHAISAGRADEPNLAGDGLLVAMAPSSDAASRDPNQAPLLLADARPLRDPPSQQFWIPNSITNQPPDAEAREQALRAWPTLRMDERVARDLSLRLTAEDYRVWEEGARLSVAGLVADEQRSIVGGRLQTIAATSRHGRMLAETRMMWLCEFLQNESAATSFFSPGDKAVYAVQGLSYGNNWVLLGGGLRWELAAGVSAFAAYDTQVNSQEMFHIGSTGLAYQW